jgi:hypothetical protein
MSVTQVQEVSKQPSVRLVFLNALPINAFKSPPLPPKFTLHIYKTDIYMLKTIIDDIVKPWNIPIINYIRHEATIKYLNSKLGLNLVANAGVYEYQGGDGLVIVTLRNPQRGKEVLEISDNDVDLYYVEVCY